MEHPVDLSNLLEHQPFLLRLALRLTRDESDAEDLVQQVWVRALERPPRNGPCVRGWLTLVLRRLFLNQRKRDQRRAQREERVAVSPSLPSEAQMLEEVGLQRRVAEAVISLREPVRTTIYLRYFRELGPREIGREMGVPLTTVKARLKRGREQLRVAMDREFGGDRNRWVGVLVSLARPAVLEPAALGALLMATPLKIVLVGIAGLAVTLFAVTGPSKREVTGAGPARQAPRLEAPDLLVAMAPPERREAPGISDREDGPVIARESPAIAPLPGAIRLAGQVLDVEARPVPSVEVALLSRRPSVGGSENAPVLTDDDGRFVFERAGNLDRVQVVNEAWVTVCAGQAFANGSETSVVVIVGRKLELGGSVVDQAGLPVESAQLTYALPIGFRRRFSVVLDQTIDVQHEATSDAFGRFRFGVAPLIPGATLRVRQERFLPHQSPIPARPQVEMRIELLRPESIRDTVVGTVVDELGRPVEAARVTLGSLITETDALGRFRLSRSVDQDEHRKFRDWLGGPALRIVALKAGHQPAERVVEIDRATGEPLWPDGLVLSLGPPPLTILGRVVDQDGVPVAGATLWLREVTLFAVEGGTSSMEGLLGEEIAGEPVHPRAPTWRSDAEGRFVVGGLLDRTYHLVATPPGAVVPTGSGPIAAGSKDVTITIDRTATYREFHGRVVDEAGLPLPDVRVLLMIDSAEMMYEGRGYRNSTLMADATSTAADGSFSFTSVPFRGVYLYLQGPRIVSDRWPVESLGTEADRASRALVDVVLVVEDRVHVRVVLSDTDLADRFSLLDERGVALTLRVPQGKSGLTTEIAGLTEGRSDVLSVSVRARELVLMRGDDEILRRAVGPWSDQEINLIDDG